MPSNPSIPVARRVACVPGGPSLWASEYQRIVAMSAARHAPVEARGR
jgi:hypothetical protein